VWLWDANIVRAFTDARAEGHERVRSRSDTIGWEEIGLPIVVAAELIEGRLRYLREAHRQAPRRLVVAYERFQETLHLLSLFPLVPFVERALAIYRDARVLPGDMSREDRLIAAIALAGGHRLVTRNVAHFIRVPGLVIENWIDEDL
jgi:tRNA(fMet)-specific endonuclease VapC